jgi:hypothetical protein
MSDPVTDFLVSIIVGDDLSLTADEVRVIEAIRRSSAEYAEMSLPEIGQRLNDMDNDQLRGFASNIKGIYHELQYVEAENTDGDNVEARVFEETNHAGADVVLSENGIDIDEIQMKASDSSAIIREHQEKYPDIEVAATTEIADPEHGVADSGFSNAQLEADVSETINKLDQIADNTPSPLLLATKAVESLMGNTSDIIATPDMDMLKDLIMNIDVTDLAGDIFNV